MAAKLQSVTFEVFGKVQGVWFRKYTKKKAANLGLVGWVMNTKAKTVVGCVQGEPGKVQAMKVWLSTQGSPQSRIEKCEFKEEKNIEQTQYQTFDVKR